MTTDTTTDTTDTTTDDDTARQRSGVWMRRISTGITLGLLGLAVRQQLRMPPEERTWHGEVAGFVPYDLRPPTPARVRAAWWNPDDPRLFTDRAFGLGWSVNVARLVELVRAAASDEQESATNE